MICRIQWFVYNTCNNLKQWFKINYFFIFELIIIVLLIGIIVLCTKLFLCVCKYILKYYCVFVQTNYLCFLNQTFFFINYKSKRLHVLNYNLSFVWLNYKNCFVIDPFNSKVCASVCTTYKRILKKLSMF